MSVTHEKKNRQAFRIMPFLVMLNTTKFGSPTLEIEETVGGSELGSVAIWNSILEAIYRPRFGVCAMKYCVGNRYGSMSPKCGAC